MPSNVDDLLTMLDAADMRLRDVYRLLADDPSLAEHHASELAELHAKRRELAEAAGLAVLAERRRSVIASASTTSAPAPETAPTPSAPETAPEIEPPSSTFPPVAEQSGLSVAVAEAPISADVLDEWKERVRVNGVGHVAYADRVTATWEATLHDLMTTVGVPRDVDRDLASELHALDAISTLPLIARWSSLPHHAQQPWLAMLVARTRSARSVAVSQADRSSVKTIISRYPPWAFEHRPGHVNGLKVTHEPEHATWSEDARVLWAALDAMLATDPTWRAPAKNRKKTATDDESNVESLRPIDGTWPLWPLVRGKSVVMVGGEPREANRLRLERQFEVGSLEWLDIQGPRKVAAVVARIRKGSIDIVVLLKGLIDHSQSDSIIAAAKESSVAWALVESYGATSIKAGLDRFLRVAEIKS